MNDINRHALRKARDIMLRHAEKGRWFEGERLSPETVALMRFVEEVDRIVGPALELLRDAELDGGCVAEALESLRLPTRCKHAPIRDQNGWRCQECGVPLEFRVKDATPPTGAAPSVAPDGKIVVPRYDLLIRCMGGHRCTHVPGTCTATARYDV